MLLTKLNSLKNTVSNSSKSAQKEISNQKTQYNQLKIKLKELTSSLNEMDDENSNLIDALNQANIALTQYEDDIQRRNNYINALIEEKKLLEIQLQEKQNDFDDFMNSAQNEIEILKEKLEKNEDEK